MTNKSHGGASSQASAREVIACLAAHTGRPQEDFRNKHKIKRFAQGGKRRGKLIAALLARPSLKQLGLRQQHFDKAEVTGKSTVADIIGIVEAAARDVKPAKVAAGKRAKAAKKKPARTADSRTKQPAKATKAKPPAAKANKAVKRIAAKKKVASGKAAAAKPRPDTAAAQTPPARVRKPKAAVAPAMIDRAVDAVANVPSSEHTTPTQASLFGMTLPASSEKDATGQQPN